MKKFNKFLSVAVASAMVMAMAGCGNTDNGSAATGTNAATESAAASDSAASGSVFKIGGIGPTTGGAAVYGLVQQLFYQLGTTLAHSHGTQCTVTGMGIGTQDHLATAG